MVELLSLLLKSPRYLCFGMLLTCFSGFGQTYFIALFGGQIRDAFQLSHAEFGLLYSLATILSAVSLIWAGRHIDTLCLRTYTVIVCLGMVIAAILLALSPNVWIVLLGIFLVRLAGQGLFGHISGTTLARQFDAERGKAISISSMGHPIGEAFLPFIAVLSIHWIGWRTTWLVVAGFVLLILLPLLLGLLRHQGALIGAGQKGDSVRAATSERYWSQKDVLLDKRFLLLTPALLMPAMVLTGIFFHQVYLVESKGWDLKWFASSFIWFSAATILSSLTTGILVDKQGPFKLIPYFLIPFLLGLACLIHIHHPFSAILFMLGAGMSSGATPIIAISTWTEIYGVAQIGGIRSLSSSLMVLSTAITPVFIGWLIDWHISFDFIVSGLLLYMLIAAVIAAFAANTCQKNLMSIQESCNETA